MVRVQASALTATVLVIYPLDMAECQILEAISTAVGREVKVDATPPGSGRTAPIGAHNAGRFSFALPSPSDLLRSFEARSLLDGLR